MAQQVLEDFLKPLQFDQFAQRVSQLENLLNAFGPNLGVLRVEHTCALDIPNNAISAETIINLIIKTLQSWSGPKDHNFLQLFQMFSCNDANVTLFELQLFACEVSLFKILCRRLYVLK